MATAKPPLPRHRRCGNPIDPHCTNPQCKWTRCAECKVITDEKGREAALEGPSK